MHKLKKIKEWRHMIDGTTQFTRGSKANQKWVTIHLDRGNKRYFYEYYLHISGKRLSDTLRVQNVNYLFKKYWKLSWYCVMNLSSYNLKKRTGHERRKLLTFKIRGSNLLENNFCCCFETSRFPTIPFLSSSCQ